MSLALLDVSRARLASSIRQRIAGSDFETAHQRIWHTAGPRWFTEQDAIWRVHNDVSMFVGGIRALLLQSLHPVAMAAVSATPASVATRGAVCTGPATSSPPQRSGRSPTANAASPSSTPSTDGSAVGHRAGSPIARMTPSCCRGFIWPRSTASWRPTRRWPLRDWIPSKRMRTCRSPAWWPAARRARSAPDHSRAP